MMYTFEKNDCLIISIPSQNRVSITKDDAKIFHVYRQSYKQIIIPKFNMSKQHVVL